MKMKTPDLENLGSLITVKGKNECLGPLWHVPEHGTFDPTYGRVPVTKEQADIHNRLLDKAMLEGLDKNCEVSMGGSFYLHEGPPARVTTFMGTLVSDRVYITGHKDRSLRRANRNATFHRAGKVYRGRISEQHDLFNFKRVS